MVKADSSNTNAVVVPEPGLLKTLGVLNLVFGGLLLLCGLAYLNATAPIVVSQAPLQIEPEMTQAFFDEMRQQRMDDLHARAQSASSDAERTRFSRHRDALASRRTKVEAEIDFPRFNANLVWLARYFRYDALSGPALNALMVVAGVGLMLKKNWARVLGVATAALKLARLATLGAILIVTVVPHLGENLDAILATEMGHEFVAQVMDQQQQNRGGGPVGPPPSPTEIVRLFRSFSTVSAIAFLCLGSIYPLICLILLSRPGARAACVDDASDLA